MKIIHLSDLHITPAGKSLFDADPAAHLMQCIAHINKHHADAQLCVLTGDLTHAGHPLAYQRLAQCLQTLKMPVRFLMGNHDDRQAFGQVFTAQTTELDGFVQYAEILGDYEALYVDSLQDGYTDGYLCERRLQWLEQKLAQATCPILLFSHHPLPMLQYPAMDWLRLSNAEQVLPLLKRCAQPVHLFSGHVHRCSAGVWNGIPFFTVNGTNHQHELDLHTHGAATSTFEPASYAVILPHAEGVTVHFQPFGYDDSVRFPYTGNVDALKCRYA